VYCHKDIKYANSYLFKNIIIWTLYLCNNLNNLRNFVWSWFKKSLSKTLTHISCLIDQFQQIAKLQQQLVDSERKTMSYIKRHNRLQVSQARRFQSLKPHFTNIHYCTRSAVGCNCRHVVILHIVKWCHSGIKIKMTLVLTFADEYIPLKFIEICKWSING